MKNHPRSLKESLRYSIENHDTRVLGRTVDMMRFGLRMNYQECYQAAHQLTGISEEAWDDLLYEVDQE